MQLEEYTTLQGDYLNTVSNSKKKKKQAKCHQWISGDWLNKPWSINATKENTSIQFF